MKNGNDPARRLREKLAYALEAVLQIFATYGETRAWADRRRANPRKP